MTTAATPQNMPENALCPAPTGHRLPAQAIALETRDDFQRADLPEINETLLQAATDRGVAQVRAGTPLPINTHESKGDECRLADVAEARERASHLRGLLDQAWEALEQARRVLAELPPPLSERARRLVVGAVALLTIIGIVALQLLLSSSFSELLLLPFYEGLGVSDPGLASQAHADQLVLFAGALLLGAKAAAVLVSAGRLPRQATAALFLIALLFSACFALVRLSAGFSWAALAISGIELALLFSYSLLLFAIAEVLKEDITRREAHYQAQATVTMAEEQVARLREQHQAAHERAEALTASIAQREDDQRRLPLYEELARSTVKAAALFTTTELISRAAKAAYLGGKAGSSQPASTEGGAP